jgi:hypothetical protein
MTDDIHLPHRKADVYDGHTDCSHLIQQVIQDLEDLKGKDRPHPHTMKEISMDIREIIEKSGSVQNKRASCAWSTFKTARKAHGQTQKAKNERY